MIKRHIFKYTCSGKLKEPQNPPPKDAKYKEFRYNCIYVQKKETKIA